MSGDGSDERCTALWADLRCELHPAHPSAHSARGDQVLTFWTSGERPDVYHVNIPTEGR